MSNPNCDNDKCTHYTGQVRLLPTGGSGNAILCKACFKHEIAYRKDRNKELGQANQFDLPNWYDLKIYSN